MLYQVLQDIRYAVRVLRKSPTFAVVAILTLALGIGANTAIFTVVNALLLRPLPYRDADRLVTVWQDMRARGGPADEWATPGNYADWRSERSLFEEIAVVTGWRPTLLGRAEPEPIPGEQVSHEYLSVLGVVPALGRTFRAEDDVPNAPRVVVISDGIWRRHFGAAPDVVGRTVALSGQPHEIIGVLPAGFRPIVSSSAALWRPLRLNTVAPSRGSVVLRSVARLPAGVSIDRAQASANVLARRLEAQHPDFNEKTGINLIGLRDRVVGDIKARSARAARGVAFVLLIACANIANLVMARASSRGRELAVRVALGAGKGRVVRQLLTESLLLAVLGGVAGLILGWWAVDGLVAIAPASAPRIAEVRLDLTVFLFVGLLSVATGVLFGLMPALHSSRRDIVQPLKDAARGNVMAAGRRFRRALIAAEVALALMLLTGGGLLLQTFVHLRATNLGFDPENVLVGSVNPPGAGGYDTAEKHRAFYDQVLERARALPGVRRAALASVLPLGGDSDMTIAIEGRPAPSSRSQTPVTWYRLVSAEYFETMGTRITIGRSFADRPATPSVVVNETFARTYFPGEEPLGKRVRPGSDDSPWFTVVGVSADVKTRGARESTPVEMFIPYWQFTEPGMTHRAAHGGRPGAALRTPSSGRGGDRPRRPRRRHHHARRHCRGLDRAAPVHCAARRRLRRARADPGGDWHLRRDGVCGVAADQRNRRPHGTRRDLARGVPAGPRRRPAAHGHRRRDWSGGISRGRPVAENPCSSASGRGTGRTLAATAVLLLAVAALACLVPARRAMRVDPMAALRAE